MPENPAPPSIITRSGLTFEVWEGPFVRRRFAALSEENTTSLRTLLECLRQIQNPGLETVTAIGEDAQGIYTDTEMPLPETLADALREGPLTIPEFDHLARALLNALIPAHEATLVHGALRPDYIFIDRSTPGGWSVKVMGYGASFYQPEGEIDPAIYRCSAPEQWTQGTVGRRTDNYALGCVLFEALAGRPAFAARGLKEMRMKHVEHDVKHLSALAPHAPSWMTEWVMAMMSQDSENRPRHAAGAMESFNAWAEYAQQQQQQPPPMAPSGLVHSTTYAVVPQPQPIQVTARLVPTPEPERILTAVAIAEDDTPVARRISSTIAPVRASSAVRPVPSSKPMPSAPSAPADAKPGLLRSLPPTAIIAAIALLAIIGTLIMRSGGESDSGPATLSVVDGLILHLDADNASSITKKISGQVSNWADADGRKISAAQNNEDQMPLHAPRGLNGRYVVDFGEQGSGRWLEFRDASGQPKKLTTIRTAFWVLRGYGFLLSDAETTTFHRQSSDSAATDMIWDSGGASDSVKKGATWLNGKSVDGTKTGLPAGFSIVSLVTTAAADAGRLCRDRTNTKRTGGQHIAEILLYDRELTDKERQSVERYLKQKWLP
ncbi:MAG: hypothetical protein KDK97_01760 [Verrucomicrobiales bacterium]|nr:hypothetical protein [Verrucomicrobiales bacterium]MCP5557369.1 hypothetical protein [Verrucomicrobiaceae bacterium]